MNKRKRKHKQRESATASDATVPTATATTTLCGFPVVIPPPSSHARATDFDVLMRKARVLDKNIGSIFPGLADSQWLMPWKMLSCRRGMLSRMRHGERTREDPFFLCRHSVWMEDDRWRVNALPPECFGGATLVWYISHSAFFSHNFNMDAWETMRDAAKANKHGVAVRVFDNGFGVVVSAQPNGHLTMFVTDRSPSFLKRIRTFMSETWNPSHPETEFQLGVWSYNEEEEDEEHDERKQLLLSNNDRWTHSWNAMVLSFLSVYCVEKHKQNPSLEGCTAHQFMLRSLPVPVWALMSFTCHVLQTMQREERKGGGESRHHISLHDYYQAKQQANIHYDEGSDDEDSDDADMAIDDEDERHEHKHDASQPTSEVTHALLSIGKDMLHHMFNDAQPLSRTKLWETWRAQCTSKWSKWLDTCKTTVVVTHFKALQQQASACVVQFLRRVYDEMLHPRGQRNVHAAKAVQHQEKNLSNQESVNTLSAHMVWKLAKHALQKEGAYFPRLRVHGPLLSPLSNSLYSTTFATNIVLRSVRFDAVDVVNHRVQTNILIDDWSAEDKRFIRKVMPSLSRVLGACVLAEQRISWGNVLPVSPIKRPSDVFPELFSCVYDYLEPYPLRNCMEVFARAASGRHPFFQTHKGRRMLSYRLQQLCCVNLVSHMMRSTLDSMTYSYVVKNVQRSFVLLCMSIALRESVDPLTPKQIIGALRIARDMFRQHVHYDNAIAPFFTKMLTYLAQQWYLEAGDGDTPQRRAAQAFLRGEKGAHPLFIDDVSFVPPIVHEQHYLASRILRKLQKSARSLRKLQKSARSWKCPHPSFGFMRNMLSSLGPAPSNGYDDDIDMQDMNNVNTVNDTDMKHAMTNTQRFEFANRIHFVVSRLVYPVNEVRTHKGPEMFYRM